MFVNLINRRHKIIISTELIHKIIYENTKTLVLIDSY